MIPWTLLLILYRQVFINFIFRFFKIWQQLITLKFCKMATIVTLINTLSFVYRLSSGSSWPRRPKVKIITIINIIITTIVIIITIINQTPDCQFHTTSSSRWTKS